MISLAKRPKNYCAAQYWCQAQLRNGASAPWQTGRGTEAVRGCNPEHALLQGEPKVPPLAIADGQTGYSLAKPLDRFRLKASDPE
jgi:hypothetical protein